MNQNKKPSILYWGKNLINFSIFSKKNSLEENRSKTFKKEINTKNCVYLAQYSVVMPNV